MKGSRKRRKALAELYYYIAVLALFGGIVLYGKAKNSGMDEGTIKVVFILGTILVVAAIIGIGILIKHIKRKKYLNSPLGAVDQMSGEEFERYLKAHFEKLGYRVSLTPQTNDYGADLVCKNKEETLIIQAKRYRGKVGNSAIQEIVAAMGYYKADRCMVVTNSFFTPNAIELARANNVELWDRKDINKKFVTNKTDSMGRNG